MSRTRIRPRKPAHMEFRIEALICLSDALRKRLDLGGFTNFGGETEPPRSAYERVKARVDERIEHWVDEAWSPPAITESMVEAGAAVLAAKIAGATAGDYAVACYEAMREAAAVARQA